MQTSATLDFLDESQAPNYNPTSQNSQKTISLVDFINSNDQNTLNNLINTKPNTQINQNSNIESIINANAIRTINLANQQINQAIALNMMRTVNLINQNIRSQKVSLIDFLRKKNSRNINITNVPYPRFGAGKPYFTILADVQNSKN